MIELINILAGIVFFGCILDLVLTLLSIFKKDNPIIRFAPYIISVTIAICVMLIGIINCLNGINSINNILCIAIGIIALVLAIICIISYITRQYYRKR